MEINELLQRAGIYSKNHAKLFGMSEHIYKKARHRGQISAPWLRLLYLRAGMDQHWKGFKIGNGVIETPRGDIINKNQIETMEWAERLAYQQGMAEAEAIQKRLVWGT